MNILKVSALMLLIDAVLFAVDSSVYAALRRGGVEWDRLFILVLPSVLLAWGLWKSTRWGWAGSLAFSFVFGVMQVTSLITARSFRPSADLMFMLLMESILTAVFCLLLAPLAWKAAWTGNAS